MHHEITPQMESAYRHAENVRAAMANVHRAYEGLDNGPRLYGQSIAYLAAKANELLEAYAQLLDDEENGFWAIETLRTLPEAFIEWEAARPAINENNAHRFITDGYTIQAH